MASSLEQILLHPTPLQFIVGLYHLAVLVMLLFISFAAGHTMTLLERIIGIMEEVNDREMNREIDREMEDVRSEFGDP